MGSSVNKSIGFFISPENAAKIFTGQENNILDETVLDSGFIVKMDSELKSLLTELKEKHKRRFFSAIYDMKNIQDSGKIKIHDFIHTIFYFDDFKGYLIKTPDLNKYNRHNDLIDYYETVNNPNFKIEYLKSNIYPEMDYVCVKDMHMRNNEAKELLDMHYPGKTFLATGDFITHSDLRYILTANGDSLVQKNEHFQHLVIAEHESDKYFHYCINPICYAFLKSTGILRADITYLQFIQYLFPAIITTWG